MTKRFYALCILFFTILALEPAVALAHRSGCHRWHSCPSDTGSYTCGDAGYPCQYPTYPASGGVVYPPSGYYKDCYDCPIKKVPANSQTSGIGWACNTGYHKVGESCVKDASSPVNTSTTYSSFTLTLSRGMQNEQVTRLQQVLSQNPSIYPEGLVTGYFGPATERAVVRLQSQHGLEQVGYVGPKMRALLNSL